MPVYLEWVEQPSEQDRVDLDKLYKEVPSQWLEQYTAENAQDYVAKHDGIQLKLAGGRFNDRLISAASLQQHGESYVIRHLAVRSVTRERGVAHQMLVRLAQWADDQGVGLVVDANDPDLSTLLTKLEKYGFSLEGDIWKRSPEP